jgi:hypothetical protein
MSNNLTPEDIAVWCFVVFMVILFAYSAFESAKAKAFNEGYRRGRASLNVREIIK